MPIVIEHDGHAIAKPLASMEMPVETYRANARLIASSPDLLTALQSLLFCMDSPAFKDLATLCEPARDAARAAIAKATQP